MFCYTAFRTLTNTINHNQTNNLASNLKLSHQSIQNTKIKIKNWSLKVQNKVKNRASVISGHQQDKVDYRAHSALCANFRLPVTWNSTTPAAITCHKHMILTDGKKTKINKSQTKIHQSQTKINQSQTKIYQS